MKNKQKIINLLKGVIASAVVALLFMPNLGIQVDMLLSSVVDMGGRADMRARIIEMQQPYVPGEVIVKYEENRAPQASLLNAAIFNAFAEAGVAGDIELLEVIDEETILLETSEEDVTDIAEQLTEMPFIEYAQPNFIYEHRSIVTNDPSRAQQWALDNTGQSINGSAGIVDADMDAPEAWQISGGSPAAGGGGGSSSVGDIVVAVLDSGVAYNHPDLTANMWNGSSCVSDTGAALGSCVHGYDAGDNDRDPAPSTSAHGTMVSGVIAATQNNGIGITGIAPQAKIMAIKAYPLTTIALIQGIDFATANGADIINASWGASTTSCAAIFDQSMFNAIEAFPGLFIAAAGNSAADHNGNNHFDSPADYGHDTACWTGLPNVVSVAATNQQDQLASFSDYGAGFVDIAAPGQNIYTTTLAGHEENFLSTFTQLPTGWIADAGSTWGVANFYGMIASLYSDVQNTPYLSGIDTAVTSAPIDMSGLSNARVSVNTACDTEYNATDDYMTLIASSSAGDTELARWNEYVLDQATGDNQPSGWSSGTISQSIPAQYMTADFRLRFGWVTDADADTGTEGGSCYIDSINITADGEVYEYVDGTSFSSPYAAGVAALIWGQDSSLTRDDVKDILLSSGDSLSSLAGKTVTGKRVNAHRALSLPRATSVSALSPDGVYGLSQTIEIVVTFDRSVAVTGTPILALSTGTNAPFARVDGSSVIFTYTVQAGDETADLDYASSSAISLAGGMISAADIADLPAALTLPAPGMAGSLTANAAISFDAAAPGAPTISSFSKDGYINASESNVIAITGTAEVGSSVSVTLSDTAGNTISAPAKQLAVGTTDFNISIDGTTAQPAALVDGVITATVTATDAADNASAAATLQATQDTVAPTITSITSPTPNGIYTTGDKIEVEVTFSESLSPSELSLMFDNKHVLEMTDFNDTKATATYTIQSGHDTEFLGVISLMYKVFDAAKNRADSLSISNQFYENGKIFSIDTTAPHAPFINTVSGNGQISSGEEIAIEILGTAEAESLVSITARDANGNSVQGSMQLAAGETSFTITLDGTAAQPALLADGTIMVTATATDAVGNTSIESSLSAQQDANPPTLTAIQISSNNPAAGWARVGDAVTVDITSDESLASLMGSIAGLPATISGSGQSFSAQAMLTNAIADGALSLSFTAIDAGGNSSIATATTDDSRIIFDKTAPTEPTGITINGSTNAVLTADSISAVAIAGIADANTAVTVIMTDSAGTSATGAQQLGSSVSTFTVSLNVAHLIDGPIAVTVRSVDTAGNASSIVNITTRKDMQATAFASIHLTSDSTHVGFVSTGDTITLAITTLEDVASLTTTIAGNTATVTGSGTDFVATYVLTGDEPEGTVAIRITATDEAGNIATATATTNGSTLNIDRTAPRWELGLPNMAPTYFVLRLMTNEPATCHLKLDDLDWQAFKITGALQHNQHLADLSVGAHSMAVSCVDRAGNASDITSSFNVFEQAEISAGGEDIETSTDRPGESSVSAGVTQINFDDDTHLDISAGMSQAANGIIQIGGADQQLDSFTRGDLDGQNLSQPITIGGVATQVTQAVSLRSGTAGTPLTLTNNNRKNMTVELPDGVAVLAGSSWDGTVQPPITTTASGSAPAGFRVGSQTFSVGSATSTLLFDQPATLTLTGVTGAFAYQPAGSTAWQQITNTCGGSYAAPTAPAFPGECTISNNTDTKIVTYHFTSFATLDAVVSSGGGGGGGTIMNITEVFTIPTTRSSSVIKLNRPTSLEKIDGTLPRPLRIEHYYQKHVFAALKGTQFTTADGNAYTGIITPPTTVARAKVPLAPTNTFITSVSLTADSTLLKTDTPYALKIMLPRLPAGVRADDLMVSYYDPALRSYQPVAHALSADASSLIIKPQQLGFIIVTAGGADESVISAQPDTAVQSTTGEQPATSSSTLTVETAFADLSGHWARSFVDDLAAQDVVQTAAAFRPSAAINRAELAKIIVTAFDISLPNTVTETGFTDVPADSWFAPFVVAARDAGAVRGYADGSFRPDQLVNRAEALQMIMLASGLQKEDAASSFADVPADSWFAAAAGRAQQLGIVNGYDEIAASDILTRKLQIGHKGDDVRLAQEMLKEQGYWFVPVNGYFDRNTQKAVARYQYRFPQEELRLPDGLGAVGSRTAEKLLQVTNRADLATQTVFRPAQAITRAEIAKIAVLSQLKVAQK